MEGQDRFPGSMYQRKMPVRKEFKKPSLAKQSFKDECDINNILKNIRNTGGIEAFREGGGRYEDVSSVPDYHTAQNIVIHAQAAFNSLPSDMRRRFENDPAQFLAFTQDPKNLEEMQELGMVDRPEPPPRREPLPDPPPRDQRESEQPAPAPQEGA